MSREEQINKALDLINPPPDRRDECRRDIERALDIIAGGERAVVVTAGITKKKLRAHSAALRRLQITSTGIIPAITRRVIDRAVDFDRCWTGESEPSRGWKPPPPGLKERDAVQLARDLLVIWDRRAWLTVSRKSNWYKLAVVLYGEPRDLYRQLRKCAAAWASSNSDPLLQRLRDTAATK